MRRRIAMDRVPSEPFAVARRKLRPNSSSGPARAIRSWTIAAICCARPACGRRRQRLMLGELLFSRGGRHVTADMIYTEAAAAKHPYLAGHRLQHAEPVHRGRPAAPDRRRRIEIVFRYQPDRPPSFLRRSRRQAARRSRTGRRDRHAAAAVCRATRSRGSMSSSICAASRPDAPDARRVCDAVGIATIAVDFRKNALNQWLVA